MRHLIKHYFRGEMRCGEIENDLAYQTANVDNVDCYGCLEAVLKHSHSQVVLDRYIELERMARETSINPS